MRRLAASAPGGFDALVAVAVFASAGDGGLATSIENRPATNAAIISTAAAAQMAGLDSQVCGSLLQNLVDAGYLEQRLRGVFVRRLSPSH